MKKLLFALFLVVLVSIPALANDQLRDCLDCKPVFRGIPLMADTNGAFSTGTVAVLSNRAFVIGYDSERMNPLWACYRVCSTTHTGSTPSFGWRIDHRTEASVSECDYKHTGYQRGHMVPKSAMYHCYGHTAVHDTFQLSNACPQRGELNNGPWGDLEDLVRDTYSINYEEVWVIAGPIFDDANGREYLTKDQEHSQWRQKPVEIPDSFYKIIIDEIDDQIRTIAFIIDHSEGYGYGSGDCTTDRLSGFLRSIDEIEYKTGLDFLWELDDALEDELEKDPAPAMW